MKAARHENSIRSNLMPIALQRNYMRFGRERLIPSPTAETLYVGPFAKLLRHAKRDLRHSVHARSISRRYLRSMSFAFGFAFPHFATPNV
jgi:hypothetical protein